MCFELMMETCMLASYRVIHSGNTGTKEVINSAIFAHRPHTIDTRDYKGDREGIPHIHPIP